MQIQDAQQVDLTVSTVDAAGNPSTDTGTLTWSVDDATLLSLSDTTGTSITVAAVGPLGTATVTVSDAETDGENFTGSLAIDIVGGNTTEILIDADTPVAKPTPTPAP